MASAGSKLKVYSLSSNPQEQIRDYVAGKEKIDRGEALDIMLASEMNVNDYVPMMIEGAYKKEA